MIIKFVIFDIIISNMPYEIRMDELKKLNLPPHVSIVDIRPCLGMENLTEQLNNIVLSGGEGIVLTKPQSLYESGRTKNRLKVKVIEKIF